MTTAHSSSDRRGDLALRLLVGAAVLDVLGALLGLTRIGAAVEVARSRPDADPSTIGAYVAVGIGIVLAVELAHGVLLVALGRLARRGRAWAALTLIVLTALALLAVSEGSFLIGAPRLLLAAGGTALMLIGRRPATSA